LSETILKQRELGAAGRAMCARALPPRGADVHGCPALLFTQPGLLADIPKTSFNVWRGMGGNSMSENHDLLVSAASIMAGFGVVFFAFRLERELKVAEQRQARTWIAVSDWLLIAAIVISLILVVVPLVSSSALPAASLDRARAACAAAAILISGYIPSILAHYNFIYWLHKPRRNPTIPEALMVILTLVVAAMVYQGSLRWW
jgi:hypothetical protein